MEGDEAVLLCADNGAFMFDDIAWHETLSKDSWRVIDEDTSLLDQFIGLATRNPQCERHKLVEALLLRGAFWAGTEVVWIHGKLLLRWRWRK